MQLLTIQPDNAIVQVPIQRLPSTGTDPISRDGAGQSRLSISLGRKSTVPEVEQALNEDRLEPNTSTLFTGWQVPPPANNVRYTDLPGAGAPPAPIDRTPFAKRMLMRFARPGGRPIMNEWANEHNGGGHANLPGRQAVRPMGDHLVFQSRGNSFRMTPRPWDTNVYFGVDPQ